MSGKEGTGTSDADRARRSVRLSEFDNSWYDPGAGIVVRSCWVIVSGLFFQSWFPWPTALKAALLRAFGATIGVGTVIKPRVTIKYPWNFALGDFSWLGEGAWIDNLAPVTIEQNCCVSQGAMIETGNHDWSDPRFALRVGAVAIQEGAWLAVRSTVLPGTKVERNAVVGAGAVVSGIVREGQIIHSAPGIRMGEREVRANGPKNRELSERPKG